MFKVFSILALLFAYANCLSHDEAKLMYQETVRTATEAVRERGCRAHVCFALDSSGSVRKHQFELGKHFIVDITAILGEERLDGTENPTRFAAGQYGDRTYRIARMTDDVARFNREVNKSPFQHDEATSVGSGIVWCDAQLRRAARRSEYTDIVSKMVVIGDGNNNLGGDPVRRANNFRRRTPGGEISAVRIGFPSEEDLAVLNEIVGENGSVFTVDDYIDLSLNVEDLVYDICGIDLSA
eukprot:TRINITY_DN17874_c0_g1_i1.p1 TRINITY_DN17874_c0_g1~~TRINITY_DN17874_c0_g1_i1.p1  ORF type:complete len:240 (-),score=36.65 TRINITY_DN17874_c0_g1_i1:95-814(-)